MMDGTLSEVALVITALAALVNAVSSFRNGRKLDVQDKKMNAQTEVLDEVHSATNGDLAPKIADAIVEQHKEQIAHAVVDAARCKYIDKS